MKKYLNGLLVILGLTLSFSVWADQTKAEGGASSVNDAEKILIYIQPVEYTNPISLSNHYSNSYWFEQGPIVESLSLNTLRKAYGSVSLCDANQTAKVLVWLQPRMFYNPQVKIFYGQVTASVYNSKGEFKSKYVGKSKLHGFLDIKPEMWIEKAYAMAINKMVAKMQADKELSLLIDSNIQVSGEAGVPCSIAPSLPVPKIRALSF